MELTPLDSPEEPGLLGTVRRLDWRFLLPDPELGRVAYVGRHDGRLVSALGKFAGSLTVVRSQPPQPDAFDLVVATVPTGDQLATAIRLVRPGGWLYVELTRRLPGPGRVSRRSALGRVRAAGFDQVGLHCHWPSFASTVWIAPLGDPAAVRHALNRHRGGRRARAMGQAGKLLLRAGILDLAVPCVSAVAQRPEADARGMAL